MESWKEELYHHGIKGQRWGVRRYQNEDGTLTEAGKKRYLIEDEYGRTGLTKKGREYNKRYESRYKTYKNAVLRNVSSVNKDYNSEKEKYFNAAKTDRKEFDRQYKEWLNNEGKYKNKNYYQFKQGIQDDAVGSKYLKDLRASRDKLEKMVREVAKEHPLYNKSYSQLNSNTKTIEQIKYGETIVKQIMNDLRYEAYSRKLD